MRVGTQPCVLVRNSPFFFRLAECDSESLVNYFLGHLRDSVPSARRDWLPPDPLQAELSRDVDVVMDLSV